MMQPVPFRPRGRSAPAKRRTVTTLTAKLVTGAALVALLSGGLVQPAAAQDDDTIVLTAGGSTLTVSPGHADAVSAVAEAHAEPGFAETIAAGARAVADSDCGAMTEASAARAIARPDEGAATEALGGAVLSDDDDSLAVSDPDTFAEQLTAEILAENEALQMIEGNAGDDGAFEPVRAIASNQKDGREIRPVTPENCPKEEKKITPPEKPVVEVPVEEPAPVPVVVEVPVTGTGPVSAAGLASLLGAASAAAAFGAVALRKRDEDQVVAAILSARR